MRRPHTAWTASASSAGWCGGTTAGQPGQGPEGLVASRLRVAGAEGAFLLAGAWGSWKESGVQRCR